MFIQKEETYRPAHIEFVVSPDETIMPETFGNYETPEEAAKYIQGNLTCINQTVTVKRHMDHAEKSILRDKYNAVLEDQLPLAEQQFRDAENDLTAAKRRHKDALETVNATLTEVKALSQEVKRGTKEIDL